MKLSLLHRVVEVQRRPRFHVAAMLGFPLAKPRALVDELAFWAGVSAALGPSGVVDEGFAKSEERSWSPAASTRPAGSRSPLRTCG